MDPAIRHWVDLWDYLDGNLWAVWGWAHKSLSPDEVAWQPIPEVASVGWNLQHLAEMLDHYLTHVLRAAGPFRPRPLWTMQAGSQDAGRYRDLDAVADYHREVRPAYRAWLASLTNADLGRPIERSGKRTITYAWAVGHIAEHESYHLGKCTLLRTLLRHRAG